MGLVCRPGGKEAEALVAESEGLPIRNHQLRVDSEQIPFTSTGSYTSADALA